MCRESSFAASAPTMPEIRWDRGLAIPLTIRSRPMILTPVRISGMAAITTGMNCSSWAVGGMPGSASARSRANRARAASRLSPSVAAYG